MFQKTKSLLLPALPGVIIATLVVAAIIYAWIEPSVAPPGGNVLAPLNVGPTGQTKEAGLLIANNSEVITGLIVRYGNVGIGTTNPGAKLEVAGQIKITGGSPGSGKVLTSDASGLASWQAPSIGGGIPNGAQVYSAPGGFSFTTPAGTTRLWVEVYGGGGGAGADGNASAGGGAGGVAMGFINVSPGQVISGAVGAGGAGTSPGGCTGGNGGTSSFGSLSATGGLGGSCSPSYSGHPGGGGIGSGGIINQQGGAGTPGGYAGTGQGSGGSNTRGGGGGGYRYGGPINGGICGGGGGAGYNDQAGGNGGPGCVIIWW